jgi:predicted MFS family arabinose efflux permease
MRRAAGVGEIVRALAGGGRGWTLSSVALGWFLVVGTMLALPAVLPFVKESYGIDNATAGLAVTLLWIAYTATQFPAGLLTDRLGERTVLAAGLVVSCAGVALLAGAPLFAVFLGACVLLGLGNGLYPTPRVTALSRTYPERDSTALGVVMAAGNVGGAALPFAAGVVAVAVGWQSGFALVAPMFLVGALALWRTAPRRATPTVADPDGTDGSNGPDGTAETAGGEEGDGGDDADGLARRLLAALRDRRVLLVAFAVSLTFFTFQGLTAFLTTYLVSVKGIDPGTAAGLFGLLFAVAAVSQPLAGVAADEVGDRAVLVVITVFYALVLAVLPFARGAAVPLLVAVLGTQRGTVPVVNAYVAAVLPPDVRGTSYGLLRTVFTGVAATGAVVVGVFADAGLFDEAFLVLGGLAALAGGAYVVLPARDGS